MSGQPYARIPSDTDIHLEFEGQSNLTLTVEEKEHKEKIPPKIYASRRRRAPVRALHTNKVFECDVCAKAFPSKVSLITHMNIHTGTRKKFKCNICDKSFTQKRNLQFHLKKQHMTNCTCAICGKAFWVKEDLHEHMAEHPQVSYECILCWSILPDLLSLYTHTDSHIGESDLKCSICNEAFWKESLLQEHVMNTHCTGAENITLPKNKKCSVHRKKCPSDSIYRARVGRYGKMMTYKCHLCQKLFLNQRRLRNHMEFHSVKSPNGGEPHGGEIFKCKICEESLCNEADIEAHKSRHGCQKRECLICDKVLAHRMTYQYHMDMHFGIKRYKCPECPELFRNSTYLRKHFKKCHRFRDTLDSNGGVVGCLKCELCSNSFLYECDLNKHRAIHDDGDTDTHSHTKTHKCKECHKVFDYFGDLQVHLEEHQTEMQPHSITKHKPVMQPRSITKHKPVMQPRSIAKHKPVMQSPSVTEHEPGSQCHLCEKTFKHKGLLNMHMNVHFPKKKYSCPYCDKKTTFKCNLRGHILARHKENAS